MSQATWRCGGVDLDRKPYTQLHTTATLQYLMKPHPAALLALSTAGLQLALDEQVTPPAE